MNNRIKGIFIILITILSTGIITHYFTLYGINQNQLFSCINSKLYDLDIKMDLLEYCNNNNFQEKFFIEKKLKHLILNDLNILRISNPDIKSLRGTPLIALYRLIQYSKTDGLSLQNDSDVFRSGIAYLNKIKNDVRNEIQNRKNLRKQFVPKGLVVPDMK